MKTNVTDTSIDCYHDHVVPTILTLQCERVLNYVRQAGDSSIAEIARAIGVEKSSVSARRFHLIKEKKLELSSKRCCRVTGRKVQTVVVAGSALQK